MDEGDLQSMMMMTRKHKMQCTLPFANELTSFHDVGHYLVSYLFRMIAILPCLILTICDDIFIAIMASIGVLRN